MTGYEMDPEFLTLMDRVTVARGYLYLLTKGSHRAGAEQRSTCARKADEALADIARMARERPETSSDVVS